MKIAYDKEADALSITFRETTVTTKELGDGIAVDCDAEGKLAGIEVLDAATRFGCETLKHVELEGVGDSSVPFLDSDPQHRTPNT